MELTVNYKIKGENQNAFVFENEVEMAIYLRHLILSKAKEGRLNIALSGGNTPKLIFQEMAANPEDYLAWKNVNFFWVDERCVAPSHTDSNYRMAEKNLLAPLSIASGNIFRIKGENNPENEAERYEEVLTENLPTANGLPKLDIILLGLGDDGHTASIFPNEIEKWHSEKLCEVATHPITGQKRISMTGKIINNAEHKLFIVTGSSKADKIGEIIHQQKGYEKNPAALVDTKNCFWLLDNESAAEI